MNLTSKAGVLAGLFLAASAGSANAAYGNYNNGYYNGGGYYDDHNDDYGSQQNRQIRCNRVTDGRRTAPWTRAVGYVWSIRYRRVAAFVAGPGAPMPVGYGSAAVVALCSR